MKKAIRLLLLVVLFGVFCFSAYKLGSYYLEMYQSKQAVGKVAQYVQTSETEDAFKIDVDFEALRKENGDVIAWLYCEDSSINYPVVQGSDNSYYLTHLLDDSFNYNGTLFADYRYKPVFEIKNTIIYGHHMKSGNMFAHLEDYKSQEFYEKHPVMYLATPNGQYRLNLFAGLTVRSDAEIYQDKPTQEYLQKCMEQSTFKADMELPEGPIVTLSTCAYEFENARYIILAGLEPM